MTTSRILGAVFVLSMAACGGVSREPDNGDLPDGGSPDSASDVVPDSQCGGLQGKGCPTGQYCAYTIEQMCGAADATGSCVARPQECTNDYRPVCGCDGKTHGNPCAAAAAGISAAHVGVCGSVTDAAVCKDGETKPERCNTCVCDKGQWICTRLACPVCTPGETKKGTGECDVCTCADIGQWVCTGESCPPPPIGKACGARAGDTCRPDEYCAYVEGEYCGAADASAVCKPRPLQCTKEYAPVCGCDQKTYSNACTAAAAGTGVFASSECKG